MDLEEDLQRSTRTDYDKLRYLPMLVGVITPVSIIMSIPPITGHWTLTNYKTDDSPEAGRPIATTIVLCVGAGFLALANLCLLFRFMERRIVLNTWFCIFSLFIHAFFMIGSILYFLYDQKGLTLENFTGDFQAGIASATLSLFSIILLAVDYYTNDKLRHKGSGVSNKQRNLIFFFIFLVLWSSTGALIFSRVESWTFTRGVYFTLATMTTIGFGDLAPSKTETRSFLFLYATIGIVAMGILINSIRVVILESIESAFFKKMDEVGVAELEKFFTFDRTFRSKPKSPTGSPESANTRTNSSVSKDMPKVPRREMMHLEKYTHLKRQLWFSIFSLLVLWLLGAVGFMKIEGWSYFEGLYFCFVSFTTIGYGDPVPKKFSGTVFFIIYALLGLVAMAYVVSIGTELWSLILGRRARKIEQKHKRKVRERNSGIDPGLEGHERLIMALDALDNSTGNTDLDHLIRLVGIARLYHSQIKQHIDDRESSIPPEICESPQFKKVERYHKLFGNILEQSQKALSSRLASNKMSFVGSSSQHQSHLNLRPSPPIRSNLSSTSLYELERGETSSLLNSSD